jgi:hypothetical protein
MFQPRLFAHSDSLASPFDTFGTFSARLAAEVVMAALFGPGCVMSNQCRIAKRGLQVPFLESREPLV